MPPSPPRGPPRPSPPSPQRTSPPFERRSHKPSSAVVSRAHRERARRCDQTERTRGGLFASINSPNAKCPCEVRILHSGSDATASANQRAASPVSGSMRIALASFETRARAAPLVRASRTSHSSRSSSSHAPAMAAMSAVAPVCLRASAPSARKSRAGRMSSRVAAPVALRTSAVTGRRAQGMSVRARPLAHRFRISPRLSASRADCTPRVARPIARPLGCYRARIPKKARYVGIARPRAPRPKRRTLFFFTS